MICFPNAKINLGLNVVSKRTDGYHNIETIFYPIGLKDALEVLPSKDMKTYSLFSTGIEISGTPENNLVIKALNLLGAEKYIPNINIHLLKAIPCNAGLGGGSSNAAFMLKLLNDMFDLGYNINELHQFALKLGADCPFFLNNKPTFATEIGDKLAPVNLSLEDYFLLVVKPDISVSTQKAYAQIVPQQPEVSLKEIVKLPIQEWRYLMQNDFEAPVFSEYPSLAEIKHTLYNNGAIYASMSGSGSAIYGIFKTKPTIDFPNLFVWRNY